MEQIDGCRLGNEPADSLQAGLLQASFDRVCEEILAAVPSSTTTSSWAGLTALVLRVGGALRYGQDERVPWCTVATGLVLLRKYFHDDFMYVVRQVESSGRRAPSFADYFAAQRRRSDGDLESLAFAALLLAGKTEETLFPVRSLEQAVLQQRPGLVAAGKSLSDGELDGGCLDAIRDAEVELLVRLGFDIVVKHAHIAVVQQRGASALLLDLLNLGLFTSFALFDPARQHSAVRAFLTSATLTPDIRLLFTDLPPVVLHNYQLQFESILIAQVDLSQFTSQVDSSQFTSQVDSSQSTSQVDSSQLDSSQVDSSQVDSSQSSQSSSQSSQSSTSQSSTSQSSTSQSTSSQLDSIEHLPDVTVFRSVFSSLCAMDDDGSSSDEQYGLQARVVAACRPIDDFLIEATINEGTYGTVYRATETKTGRTVALKLLKRTRARSGFPYFMLREILYLMRLHFAHIIRGSAMAVRRSGAASTTEFFIVMDYVENDLLAVLKEHLRSGDAERRFSVAQAKELMRQLLLAVRYMHSLQLLHRDIKLANLLLTDDGVLKVADLGSIRDAGRKSLKLTMQVVTLWYRAPELLMGTRSYTDSIDIWSIGCLFVELITYNPLFPGQSERDMLTRMLRLKGAPPPDVWSECFEALPSAGTLRMHLAAVPYAKSLRSRVPQLSAAGLDLLERMLDWDPRRRITAAAALDHAFFAEQPLPATPYPRLPLKPLSAATAAAFASSEHDDDDDDLFADSSSD